MLKVKYMLVAVLLSMGQISKGQLNNENPFGLVYDHALVKNEAGKVNIQPVKYKVNGLDISANVYTPAAYDGTKKYPAIVIAHPNGGVKEQVSGLYAQDLANNGYITIVADASYQGASAGQPRNVDKPANRIADIQGMADFIMLYPGVDAERIALLGICGGGGYALKVAQGDKRFKAIATLSMFNSGRVRRNGFLDADTATIQTRLAMASEAKAKEVKEGVIQYMGTADPTDEEIAKIPTDLYREGYTYYYRNYAHPNSTFRYTASSLVDLMTFDANTNMELINQPLLMIAGSRADTKYMTEEVFPNAVNARSKELFILDGASHIDTYWRQEYVREAIDKLVDFYQLNIK
ncbi:alpha/beta hydrolase [Sphingobacterium rhinopitheci]|uniref:alpha/beta hydrolase n=1 Tax=Sphingobacterium rhinopitheci TaxID=2781960 RepID=UPI001F51C628|nr:alpha/beta hydrolase [Sphingobacterium rhinopitheci]MCI0921977.1 alpha/beta hydrolase [Sphingobacterium rhinopitheci]